ncbi:MAG: serine/threonine protein kinase [Deltaproteobacteria bacterium]|nr:serine/threonine protein kinase [Deltaproteobacteria bacterium]
MASGGRFCPACGERFFGNERICPADGCKLITAPVTEDLSGVTLNGKYKIARKLGEGGFGTVYEGFHLGLNKEVAVKVLNPELRGNELVVKRFLNEVQAITRLSHPHTVATHDLDQTDDGLLFLVMEKVEGKTLARMMAEEGEKSAALPWQRVVGIIAQVCESLEEAHEKGVIHRDLKPENIIVADRFGVKDYVKVLDFGIAKIVSDKPFNTLTEKGKLVGSPPYMSPEHCKGEELDGRSDLYSLGIMMYQMLTGRLPFRAKTPEHMLISHTTEDPIPIPEVAPDLKIPVELEKIVMRLLKKNRDERYRTAGDLKAALLYALETPEQGGFHDLMTRKDIDFTVEMEAKKTLKDFSAKRSGKFLYFAILALAAIASAAVVFFLRMKKDDAGEAVVSAPVVIPIETRDIHEIAAKDTYSAAETVTAQDIIEIPTPVDLKPLQKAVPAREKRHEKHDTAMTAEMTTVEPKEPLKEKKASEKKDTEAKQPEKKKEKTETDKYKSPEKKPYKKGKEGIKGRAGDMFDELDGL